MSMAAMCAPTRQRNSCLFLVLPSKMMLFSMIQSMRTFVLDVMYQRKEAMAAAQDAQAVEFIEEKGLDAMLAIRGMDLSGGTKAASFKLQRALAKHPQVLCLTIHQVRSIMRQMHVFEGQFRKIMAILHPLL